MMSKTVNIADTEEWASLVEHAKEIEKTQLKDMMSDIPRVDALIKEHNGVYVDASRQR